MSTSAQRAVAVSQRQRSLDVGFASSFAEIREAQRLRYQVFAGEMVAELTFCEPLQAAGQSCNSLALQTHAQISAVLQPANAATAAPPWRHRQASGHQH